MIMGELGCSEHKVQVHTGEDGCNHQKYGVDDLARLGLGVFYAKDEIRDPYKVGHHRQPADANKQRKAEQHIDNAHAPLRKEHLLQLFHPAPPHFPFFHSIGKEQGMMLAVTFERLCIQTPAEVVCIDNPVFAFSFETSAFGKEYEVLLNSRLL